MVPLVSVSGYLSLLAEPEHELQAQALIKLDELVDQFWMEIAEHGSTMYCFLFHLLINSSEMLYEEEKFPQRELAALLLSKVILVGISDGAHY
jgi:26S proteasome regulatory subunit N2